VIERYFNLYFSSFHVPWRLRHLKWLRNEVRLKMLNEMSKEFLIVRMCVKIGNLLKLDIKVVSIHDLNYFALLQSKWLINWDFIFICLAQFTMKLLFNLQQNFSFQQKSAEQKFHLVKKQDKSHRIHSCTNERICMKSLKWIAILSFSDLETLTDGDINPNIMKICTNFTLF
jgi:hypothetical protein